MSIVVALADTVEPSLTAARFLQDYKDGLVDSEDDGAEASASTVHARAPRPALLPALSAER